MNLWPFFLFLIGEGDWGDKTNELAEVHYLNKEYKLPFKAKGQIRYNQEDQDLKIFKENNKYKVVFKKKQKGIAAGQILAIYKKKELIASAVIDW